MRVARPETFFAIVHAFPSDVPAGESGTTDARYEWPPAVREVAGGIAGNARGAAAADPATVAAIAETVAAPAGALPGSCWTIGGLRSANAAADPPEGHPSGH